MDSVVKAEKISSILLDHKGEDVVILDVKEKTDIADYYVVATGRAKTHTRSLIEHVEEEMEKLGEVARCSEGVREGRWAVLDYGDVLVHIFNDETRVLYHLENLWEEDKTAEKKPTKGK